MTVVIDTARRRYTVRRSSRRSRLTLGALGYRRGLARLRSRLEADGVAY